MDRFDLKFLTGNLLKVGSSPLLTARMPLGSLCLSGHQGANEFTTIIRSASSSHGPGSAPTWQGWSVAIASDVAHQLKTGIAQSSTNWANLEKLASSLAPLCAMMRGLRASAVHRASMAI